MADAPNHTQGSFCWHEIGSRDAAKAKAFYAELLGWDTMDRPMGPGPDDIYTMLRVGDADVAGLYGLNGEHVADVPSHWRTYIWVDDVDATTAKATSLGATVITEPMDMPGIGQFAAIQDPTGAIFAVYKGSGHTGAAQLGNTPGGVSWNELMTPDAAKAKAFYTELIGWTAKGQDMGGFEYTVLSKGEDMVGGLMEMSGPEFTGVPPHWMNYVTVTDVDATAQKAKDLGGEVVHGPADIPNIGRFAILKDPTGAVFSVITYVMPG
jgi:predicted enzyme related to lactoylglutathione lyase